MKNVHQVLSQKEVDLARTKKELEALRMVALLLQDEEDRVDEPGEAALTLFASALARRISNAWRPDDSSINY
jgi:hypothetical protein